VLHHRKISIGEQVLGVLEDSVYHVNPFCVALVKEHPQADNVLWWRLWPGPDDGGDLNTEDVDEYNVSKDSRTFSFVANYASRSFRAAKISAINLGSLFIQIMAMKQLPKAATHHRPPRSWPGRGG